jgi:hypothetical protein
MWPDGGYLLLIQDFFQAETPGSPGSYHGARDPEVSAAPTNAGVISCFQLPGLLVNSAS